MRVRGRSKVRTFRLNSRCRVVGATSAGDAPVEHALLVNSEGVVVARTRRDGHDNFDYGLFGDPRSRDVATDAAGALRVTGLAAGSYQVTAFDPAHHAHLSSCADVTPTPNDAQPVVTLVVRPAVPLVVEIVGDDGSPVYGATVSAVLAVTAGSDRVVDDGRSLHGGLLSLAVPPDEDVRIDVSCDHYEPSSITGIRGGAETPVRIVLKRAPR